MAKLCEMLNINNSEHMQKEYKYNPFDFSAEAWPDYLLRFQITLKQHYDQTLGDPASDVCRPVYRHIYKCQYFSRFMEESTDISDIAEVEVFNRSVVDDFELIEKRLQLESIHSTTVGRDLFETI
ncbi:hypothetical protein RF11_13332 [Thelohanellus kitauei]|uniref:Uncharacterized protein n=1 Tax=Thelohanellus kitauei TaxID=669202 RepID=A0A0C2J9C7_THEKT|nr:hypothetical protein RF11_13332 [Thelohanellus kitauei]